MRQWHTVLEIDTAGLLIQENADPDVRRRGHAREVVLHLLGEPRS